MNYVINYHWNYFRSDWKLLYLWLSSFFVALSAPFLPVASRSASTLGSTKHVITSLSSLSRLKSSFSPASSSNSCCRGLTEAGSASATNLLTSLKEAGTFPPPVFFAFQRCKSCSFFDCSFSRFQHPWSWLRSRLIPLGIWELNLIKISSHAFAFYANVLLL